MTHNAYVSPKARLIWVCLIGVLLSVAVPIATAATVDAQTVSVRINEFQAINDTTVNDNTGDFVDWIELQNSSTATVNLAGWTIADGGESFTFDAQAEIEAGGYLLLWASDDVTRTAPGFVHLPFKLSGGGDSLTLRTPAGVLTSPGWPAPETYPAQLTDGSFGIGANGTIRFFTDPTPGSANSGGVEGVVEPVTFSVAHGFYDTAQNVVVASTTPGSSIRYTTNGDVPSSTSGTILANGGSIVVDGTTMLRAVAYRSGWITSPVETRSYLFTSDIIAQQGTPPGFPSGPVNGQLLDYGMDQRIVSGSEALVEDALTSIPTISIVTDLDNLFDQGSGIYVNAFGRGSEWERQASVELIDPSGAEPGFDIEAGMRMRGGFSRNDFNPKHSFRLFFGSDYEGALDYPFFGDSGDDRFEKIDLRTSQNFAWHARRSTRANFIDEVWSRDTQSAMGQPHTRSRQYHLYLNGVYWGIYMTQERVSGEYGESYLGGGEDDYDIIKRGAPGPEFEATAGDEAAWRALFPLVSDLNVTDAEFAQLATEIDLVNLADYYLLHFFTGDYDGSPSYYSLGSGQGWAASNNFYAVRNRNRVGPAAKWQFFDHDSEHSLCANQGPSQGENIDNTPPWNLQSLTNSDFMSPAWLHAALTSHPTYRQIFQDRVQQHMLSPGGALTLDVNLARLEARANEVSPAVEAESARWGDGDGSNVSAGQNPYGRTEWNIGVQQLRDCLQVRPAIVEAQLRVDGLWPTVEPASITPASGAVAYGTPVTVSANGESGTVYFTVDGSDPRAADGSVASGAQVVAGPVAVTGDLVLRARLFDGVSWSTLAEEAYSLSTPAGPVPLALNEFNAVSGSNFLGGGLAADVANGSDATFGRVLGNGGDWFELVVIEDRLDVRGWTIEVWNDNAVGTLTRGAALTFADSVVLADLRAGTLVTVTEDIADDVSYAPMQNDWHINLQANNQLDGGYITAATQSNFAINNDNTQIAIFDAAGAPVQLRTGEGTVADVSVGSDEVFKLEGVPTSAVAADSNLYADGTSSTWGLPNIYDAGVQTQDLSSLRINFGDVNCDGRVNIGDALVIAQWTVNNRSEVASCPLGDPVSQIYVAAADVDGSGSVNIGDALLIAQCSVNNANVFCP